MLDRILHRIKPGFAILMPGLSGPMKLYTLYAPPNHRDGVVHATKADEEADEEPLRWEDDRIAIGPAMPSDAEYGFNTRVLLVRNTPEVRCGDRQTSVQKSRGVGSGHRPRTSREPPEHNGIQDPPGSPP